MPSSQPARAHENTFSLVDSHCHLDFFLEQHPQKKSLPTIETILENANAAQNNAKVAILLSIATSLPQQQTLLDICNTYSKQPLVFCSAGTHPTYLSETNPPPTPEQLLQWQKEHPERIIAFGESGLDFFRPTNPPASLQETSFRNHILAAQEAQIPLVVHNRAADRDIERILIQTQKEKSYPCILHCFAASQRLANIALEIGCILSFAGLITYRSARDMLDPIVRATPLDALLLETDSPFLPPSLPPSLPSSDAATAKRNKRPSYAEPAMISITAQHIADLKNLSLREVAEATTRNFLRIFKVALKESL